MFIFVADWPTEKLEAVLEVLYRSKDPYAVQGISQVKGELRRRFGKFAKKRPNTG